jgi:hypothetical protein
MTHFLGIGGETGNEAKNGGENYAFIGNLNVFGVLMGNEWQRHLPLVRAPKAFGAATREVRGLSRAPLFIGVFANSYFCMTLA